MPVKQSRACASGAGARRRVGEGARAEAGNHAVKEARSFVVSSLRRRLGLVICREFARHRIRRVPYIGVPRAVGERRILARRLWQRAPYTVV